MGENEVKNPIDGGKPTSETDIDGGKLTSKTDINGKKLITKPDFPTLFIKNVYDIYSVKEAIRILLDFVVRKGGVEYCKN